MGYNKQAIHSSCEAHIIDKMRLLQLAIDEAQLAANSEEKSSAGDKYETGRAMSHLQRDMHARQLDEMQQTLNQLRRLLPIKSMDTIGPGALILTESGNYYLAAGLGKIDHNGEQIMVISPSAPLGKTMLGKKENDTFPFNGKMIRIKMVC